MKSIEQSIVRMFCPNCANKLMGFANETGMFKTRCSGCGILITSTQKYFKKEKTIIVKEN